VATVTADDLGASWHEGCPVDPADLRMVTVTYVDFGGNVRSGRLVVNADVVDGVIDVFRQLYEAGFPMHEVKPIVTQAEYDDFETPASTGFSCRNALGGSSWSQHAYGHAIDINPVENPYVQGGTVTPAAGAAYLDRSDVRPGMATSGGVLVRAFRSIGWGWGASFGDYQHFSTTGT
jgi:hypothetical protein